MTLLEIKERVEADEKRRRLWCEDMYMISAMTANFVWKIGNGKSIPPFSEIFPQFTQKESEKSEEQIQNELAIYKEQWIDLAHIRKKNKGVKQS